MHVVVYSVDDACAPFTVGRHWGESAFVLNLKLRCLAREDVYADCDKAAAAQVFYDTVTLFRKERLYEMNAPASVIAAHANPKAVEAQLASFSWLPSAGYIFDNGVQAWLIQVESIEEQANRTENEEGSPHVR
jgi:hypothetical protein